MTERLKCQFTLFHSRTHQRVGKNDAKLTCILKSSSSMFFVSSTVVRASIFLDVLRKIVVKKKVLDEGKEKR